MNDCPKCGSACIDKEFIACGKLTKYVTASNMDEFIQTVTLIFKNNTTVPYRFHTVIAEHIRNTCSTCGYCILSHPLDYEGAHNEYK